MSGRYLLLLDKDGYGLPPPPTEGLYIIAKDTDYITTKTGIFLMAKNVTPLRKTSGNRKRRA